MVFKVIAEKGRKLFEGRRDKGGVTWHKVESDGWEK